MKPSRILLFILSTFIVLGTVCVLFAGKTGAVRVPSLASVLPLPESVQEDTIAEQLLLSYTNQTNPIASDTTSTKQLAADSIRIRREQVELPAPAENAAEE